MVEERVEEVVYNTNLEVATSAVIVMKLIVPTRNTRFLPNLTLD